MVEDCFSNFAYGPKWLEPPMLMIYWPVFLACIAHAGGEHDFSVSVANMVIPPPVRPARVVEFLKPYVLKMHFTNKYVSAQVLHSPTATVASSASSQEKVLRTRMENTRDVAAAAKIGKILGERLLLKEIPAVTVFLKREQRYHGKVKAVIDSVRAAGVKLI
ncbi:hypothetical protein IFM89_010264 [Coptis chinensis]|uniref:50S ribosomal protein L18, chloroplastic n=1 Tax=Coptis chinensis TaxID=261450 RepID=A0A835LTY2_9MAGN|nr:hypothetical protein IFM89_010264 [Coptis chinensis]